jgi:Plasmid pRiA4b ORF-3-like protein
MPGERWLSIKVELLSGGGLVLDQPAGRLMIASPSHTLAELSEAIDIAFARWDLAHLHEFELGDGRRALPEGDEFDPNALDSAATPLGSLGLGSGSTFEYVFDLGDDWRHRCEVRTVDVDPEDEYGEPPDRPVPIWGWGWIPDQYGRTEEASEEE